MFELAPAPKVPGVHDIVEKLARADRMQRVIDSLGPWASAAQDDPDCCDKLKTIFNAVLELANVGTDFCMACGASVPPKMGEGTCPKCDPAGCAVNAANNAGVADLQNRIDDETGEYIANGGLCDEDKCVIGCRGCGERADKRTALDVLRKMDELISLGDLCYHIREREAQGWEGPKVVAWGICCAQMRELFQKDEQIV